MKKPPIANAARALTVIYEGQPWFVSVGIADETLIVYTKSRCCPDDQRINWFVGHKVEFHKFGKVRPA